MNAARLVAIGAIYGFTAIAWFILGGSLLERTGQTDARLSQEVVRLWGGEHVQRAPTATVRRTRTVTEDVQDKDASGALVTRRVDKTVVEDAAAPLDQSRIAVDLSLAHRKKGLLWYDTYAVGFTGNYVFRNPDAEQRTMRVEFLFPAAEGLYDDFAFEVDGQPSPAVTDLSRGAVTLVDVPSGGAARVRVRYRSRGLGSWSYAFGPSGVAQVRDFDLRMRTDFAAIDFPAGAISPTQKRASGGGWDLGWSFRSLVTGQRIGLDTPGRLNPGPSPRASPSSRRWACSSSSR